MNPTETPGQPATSPAADADKPALVTFVVSIPSTQKAFRADGDTDGAAPDIAYRLVESTREDVQAWIAGQRPLGRRPSPVRMVPATFAVPNTTFRGAILRWLLAGQAAGHMPAPAGDAPAEKPTAEQVEQVVVVAGHVTYGDTEYSRTAEVRTAGSVHFAAVAACNTVAAQLRDLIWDDVWAAKTAKA